MQVIQGQEREKTNQISNQDEDYNRQGKKSKKCSMCTIIMMVLTCVAWITWIVCRFTIGGMCDRPELASNFEKSLYLGRWYQMF